jgi:hypothetical protein
MASASISIAARAAASQSISGPELMGKLHHRTIEMGTIEMGTIEMGTIETRM